MRLAGQQPLCYRTLLSLIALFVVCPLAVADAVRGLQEIYATPIPTEIRRNFDVALRTIPTCHECHVGILDGEKFIDIYNKKFLVIGLQPNSFGGVWAIIAVEGEPKHAFRLWLYDIADNEYELRSIEELSDSLGEALIRQLQSADFRHYWL